MLMSDSPAFDAPRHEAVTALELVVRDAPSKHPALLDLDLERALSHARAALARCSEELRIRGRIVPNVCFALSSRCSGARLGVSLGTSTSN